MDETPQLRQSLELDEGGVLFFCAGEGGEGLVLRVQFLAAGEFVGLFWGILGFRDFGVQEL